MESSKNKSYSCKQIDQLCQDLENKVAPRYKELKMPMDLTKQTVSNYQVLADAISKGCDQFAIKPAWLRDLFAFHRKQPSKPLSLQYMEACCLYLGTTETAYFEKMEDLQYGYLGKYQVYWKGTSNNNPDVQPFYPKKFR
jgi:hypothetical protein